MAKNTSGLVLVGGLAAAAAAALWSRKASASTRSSGAGPEPAPGDYPPVPVGLDAIRRQFGDIIVTGYNAKGRDGEITSPAGWEAKNMIGITLPNGIRVYCNRQISRQLYAAVDESMKRFPHYPITKIGCFNPRVKASGPGQGPKQSLSLHSWGVAVDVNDDGNAMGTAGTLPHGFPEVWEAIGWVWGGRWSGASRDPMHFQWAKGY